MIVKGGWSPPWNVYRFRCPWWCQTNLDIYGDVKLDLNIHEDMKSNLDIHNDIKFFKPKYAAAKHSLNKNQTDRHKRKKWLYIVYLIINHYYM